MRILFLLSTICFIHPVHAEDPRVTFRLTTAKPGESQRIEVIGLGPVRLARLGKLEHQPNRFTVYVLGEDERPKTTPLFGGWSIKEDRVVFAPRYPLVPNVAYLARLSLSDLPTDGTPDVVEGFIRVAPLPPRADGQVTHVFPTTSVLPENALKFYLYFSVPMSRGEAYRRIRLVQANGEPVAHPFLELEEELWDHTGTRFTLFFDPGRVKRGLKPREQFGPALEEGASYELVVDRTWPDDRGRPLAQGFRKRFRVVAPDYVQPDSKKWQWSVPQANTAEPLVVTFSEPLDQAMLKRVLVVLDETDGAVEGKITIAKNETVWSFRPARAWRPGQYSLSVDAALEDRAGNSIGRPFEVDIFRRVERQVTPRLIELAFTVE